MGKPNRAPSRLRETFYTALASSVTLLFVRYIGTVVKAGASYFQQPDVVYYTQEMPAFPIAYKNNKPAPADIQSEALLGEPIENLQLQVRITAERSQSVLSVRIPFSSDDGYLGGWMTKSEDPSSGYMLDAKTEHTFHGLLPGDEVNFYLYLTNAKSDLADRIQVFDGQGRPASHYHYVPVRSDAIIISRRRGRIYFVCVAFVVILLLGVILLMGVSRVREHWQASISADTQCLANVREPAPTSSRGSGGEGSDEPGPSPEPLDGDGGMRSSCSSPGYHDRGPGGHKGSSGRGAGEKT